MNGAACVVEFLQNWNVAINLHPEHQCNEKRIEHEEAGKTQVPQSV